MRGKKHFRKIIQRMNSGRFRWVISGIGDVCLRSGEARSKMQARDQAICVERELLARYERKPVVPAVGPAFSFRSQFRSACARRDS